MTTCRICGETFGTLFNEALDKYVEKDCLCNLDEDECTGWEVIKYTIKYRALFPLYQKVTTPIEDWFYKQEYDDKPTLPIRPLSRDMRLELSA